MWARLDDGYPNHPKIAEVGIVAAWLNTCAICYSARYLTDGKIPAGVVGTLISESEVMRLTGSPVSNLVDALIRAGLWESAPGGFLIHDYHECNPPAAEVKRKRADAKERKERSMSRARDGKDRDTDRDPDRVTHTNPVPMPVPVPVPMPVPEPMREREEHEESHVASGRRRVREERPREYHQEAEPLATLLADLIESNGSKRPNVTASWIQEIDRMIRLDGRSPADIAGAIHWSQRSTFWRANILSPKKLREKFDTLRLQAERENASKTGVSDAVIKGFLERGEQGDAGGLGSLFADLEGQLRD